MVPCLVRNTTSVLFSVVWGRGHLLSRYGKALFARFIYLACSPFGPSSLPIILFRTVLSFILEVITSPRRLPSESAFYYVSARTVFRAVGIHLALCICPLTAHPSRRRGSRCIDAAAQSSIIMTIGFHSVDACPSWCIRN